MGDEAGSGWKFDEVRKRSESGGIIRLTEWTSSKKEYGGRGYRNEKYFHILSTFCFEKKDTRQIRDAECMYKSRDLCFVKRDDIGMYVEES